jgi:hypothetical protein
MEIFEPRCVSLISMSAAKASDVLLDSEARSVLWREICEASVQLASRCSVFTPDGSGALLRLDAFQPRPAVPPWQLVEALSLLSIILRADEVRTNSVNLFRKTGPIEITEGGLPRFIWSQQYLRGQYSELGGRPDLIVTSSADAPTPTNILRAVEVKCVKDLGTQHIRGEFGKAHDLRVATYFIWSFYKLAPRVKAGAQGLGLDIEELGFDSPLREDIVKRPMVLLSHVSNTLEQARLSRTFARALEDASRDTNLKLAGPRR